MDWEWDQCSLAPWVNDLCYRVECTSSRVADITKLGGDDTAVLLFRGGWTASRSLLVFDRGQVLCLWRNSPVHQPGLELESSFAEKALGVLVHEVTMSQQRLPVPSWAALGRAWPPSSGMIFPLCWALVSCMQSSGSSAGLPGGMEWGDSGASPVKAMRMCKGTEHL